MGVRVGEMPQMPALVARKNSRVSAQMGFEKNQFVVEE